VQIHDPRLAKIVRQCQELPGHDLFQYLDTEGGRCRIESQDVNEHLKSLTRREITAKDFRAWSGTVLAPCALHELGPGSSETESKRQVVNAIDSGRDPPDPVRTGAKERGTQVHCGPQARCRAARPFQIGATGEVTRIP
jgi:hypothetical protein